MKILFIGILTEEVLNLTKKDGLVGTFVDVNEATEEIGRICNAYRAIDVDLTVLLTHIGFEEDKILAAKLDPAWGVDVIIGGHSHTFLTEPEVVNNIVIVQAGTGTDQIGRFDMVIDTKNNQLDSYRWQSVPICAQNCPRDEKLEKTIEFYKKQTDKKYNRLVTKFKRQLTHPSRYCETEIGGLFADILCESLGLDVMLLGSGSLRTTKLGPIMLFSDFVECFAYDDAAHLLMVTGAQFKKMIKYMLQDEVWIGMHCEFYQFSKGLKVVYNCKEHNFKEFTFQGEPVEDDKIYRIGLQHYHFLNMESSFSVSYDEVCKNGKPRMISTSCRDILDEYLSSHQNLDHKTEGRLIVEQE